MAQRPAPAPHTPAAYTREAVRRHDDGTHTLARDLAHMATLHTPGTPISGDDLNRMRGTTISETPNLFANPGVSGEGRALGAHPKSPRIFELVRLYAA